MAIMRILDSKSEAGLAKVNPAMVNAALALIAMGSEAGAVEQAATFEWLKPDEQADGRYIARVQILVTKVQ